MPLTKAEAALLSRRTGMATDAFTWKNNGVLTLLNDVTTRACVFLLTASADAVSYTHLTLPTIYSV